MKRVSRRELILPLLAAMSLDAARAGDVGTMMSTASTTATDAQQSAAAAAYDAQQAAAITAANAQAQAAIAQQNAEAKRQQEAQNHDIRTQYADKINSAQAALDSAKNDLATCAIKAKMGEASAKGDAAQQKGQAGQTALSQALPTLGKAAEDAFSGAGANKKQTAADLAEANKQASENAAATITGSPDKPDGFQISCSKNRARNKCTPTYQADMTKVSQTCDTYPLCSTCMSQAYGDCQDLSTKVSNLKKDYAGGSHLSSGLMEGALAASVAAFGYGMQVDAAKKSLEAALANVASEKQLCDNAANLAIKEAQRALDQLTKDRDAALVLASLQSNNANPQSLGKTLSSPSLGSNDVPVDNNGGNGPGTGNSLTTGGGALAGPMNLAQAGPSPAPTDSAGGAAGAPAAAGPGGVAANAPGDSAWTFGNGQGNAAAGSGLPLQAEGGGYSSEGGGGGFFGGPAASGGGDGAGLFAAMNNTSEGERGPAGFGDGGLNVLLSKMRQRLAAHGPELRRSVDLAPVARASTPARTTTTRALATQN